jgi:putative membrane protein
MKNKFLIVLLFPFIVSTFAFADYGMGEGMFGNEMFGEGFMGHMGYMGGFGLIFWIILAVVIYMLLKQNNKKYDKPDSALDILNNRFARGEISKEEYLSIKETLTKGK